MTPLQKIVALVVAKLVIIAALVAGFLKFKGLI